MGVKITELPTTTVNEADYIPVANATSGTRKVLMEDVLNQASPALDTALSPTSENAVQNKAIAAAVNTVSVGLTNAQNDIDDLKSAIDLGSITPGVKSALLTLLEHVAYTDENGQDYYDDLYDALYNRYWQVTNNLTNCTTSNASEQTLKSGAYSATITASTGYVMAGATVSITMGGVDVTASVYSNGVISIPAVTGALVITISAAAKSVSSLDAVFTQGDNLVFSVDTLDSLKQYLVVTATYDDASTAVVSGENYTLSGTLTAGTSTITVTFLSASTTFNVAVTAATDITPSISTAETNSTSVGLEIDSTKNTIRGYSKSAGTYNSMRLPFITLRQGYRYRISCHAEITSGTAKIALCKERTSSNIFGSPTTTSSGDLVADGIASDSANFSTTANLAIFITWNTAELGDVTASNIRIVEYAAT